MGKGSLGESAAGLPPGCLVEDLPDGSLRVTRSQAAHDQGRRASLGCAALWLLLLLAGMALTYGPSPAAWSAARVGHDLGPLGGILLLIGVFLLWGGIPRRGAACSEEWVAGPDSLEYRLDWGGSWGGRRTVRRYSGGEWRLVHRVPGRSDDYLESWELTFNCWRMRHGRGVLWSVFVTGDGAELGEQMHRLGDLLAVRTGWPLYLP